MSKRRFVSDSFWSDGRIEELDPLERYLYLYLITNQYVGLCGIYEIKIKRMAFETGIEKEMIEKMVNRFQEVGKVFYKDGIMFIVNFVKNQSVKTVNDNLRKGIEREFKELGSEKTGKVLDIEGACKVVKGAYKDVGIPYFTLLYSTLPNGDDNQEETISYSEDYSTLKEKRNNINQYIRDKNNQIVKCSKDTKHIKAEFKKLRKDYSMEDFERALKKLAVVLSKKNKDSPGYGKKRSLYDFLKNGYGFINYVHKG